jgi:hypothetical protein
VGQAYNPRTGAYGATQQGSNAYGQWGSSVVTKGNQWAATQHTTTSNGTVGSFQNSAGGKAVAAQGANGSATAGKTASGNMYASKDGNVYKNTNGSWQKYDNGSWSTVNKPTAPVSSAGQQKAQSAQPPRAATAPSGNPSQPRPSAMANQQQRSPTAAGGTPPQANYQPQRTAAAPGGNAPPARSNAQPYQQQRPTQQPVAQQRSAGGEYGQLNQDMQNRQRGAVQSQRFSQAGNGGGRGAGFRR